MLQPCSVKHINTLQGSRSRREFSTGNTYPAVGVPRGMTYWTPQTTDERFLFNGDEDSICGIRATHSPSPWMGDYGHFDIFPVVGPLHTTPAQRASNYDRESLVLEPNRAKLSLLRYGIDMRFAATSRCAAFEINFPSSGEASIVLQTGTASERTYGEIEVHKRGDQCEIRGISYSNHGGCPENYGCFFIVEIKAPAQDMGVFDVNLIAAHGTRHVGPQAGAYVCLEPGQKVIVRVATSFISFDQARRNLHQEIGRRGVEQVAQGTEALWANWLGRIQVEGGNESDRRCLASAMYRVGLFPMCGHEPDSHGGFHHRSPYDGQVHSGKLYTNNGFWDTHRTVYPLLALIDPQGYGEIVDGFLQAYRQTGWLPKWASPGFRDCMISTHIDAVISEAVMRGIPGFDHEEAYQAIRRNAFDHSKEPTKYGRVGLEPYDRLGYVPADVASFSVSRTLDFAYCDWCVAQMASRLGHQQDATYLLSRSKNYRNLWNSPQNLMRPKLKNGAWQEPWNPLVWGHSYVEGGAWQHSFNVPHDLEGLASLLGGPDKLIGTIEGLLQLPATYEHGSYGTTIHEMTEMAEATDLSGASFGQYAHSNQPVHGFLWYPAALGKSEWTTVQIERVMRSLYTPENLPGDEDNGEMSAWYILAAMGKFPICPGSGRMVSAPCRVFDQVLLRKSEPSHRRIDVGSSTLSPEAPITGVSAKSIDHSST
jgi:predicted alpha-1,2-mannosidase